MKNVSLKDGLKPEELIVKPFQERLSVDEEIQVSNGSKTPLTLVFNPTNPFSFPNHVIELPEDQNVVFKVSPEIHFPYSVSDNGTRPRTRTAMMTVVQPQESMVGTVRRDGSLPVLTTAPSAQELHIKILLENKTLRIEPPATVFRLGQSVKFENTLKLPLEIVFRPATPFADSEVRETLGDGDDKLFIVSREVDFVFRVRLDVTEPIAAPVQGVLQLKN